MPNHPERLSIPRRPDSDSRKNDNSRAGFTDREPDHDSVRRSPRLGLPWTAAASRLSATMHAKQAGRLVRTEDDAELRHRLVAHGPAALTGKVGGDPSPKHLGLRPAQFRSASRAFQGGFQPILSTLVQPTIERSRNDADALGHSLDRRSVADGREREQTLAPQL